MLLFESRQFAIDELELLHLLLLEPQELEPLLRLLLPGRRLLQGPLRRARQRQGRAKLPAQGRRASERVEGLALDLGPHQRPRVALAVDLDEVFAERAQRREGRRSPADAAAALALRIDDPRHQQEVVVDGARAEFLHERRDRLRTVAAAKPKLTVDLHLALVATHQPAWCLLAAQQFECRDQQRLAAAGFAGDDV